MSALPPPRPAPRLLREPLSPPADRLATARWLRGEARPVALAGAWAGGGLLLSSYPARIAGADEDPFTLLDGQAQTPGDATEPHVGVGVVTEPGVGAGVGGGWFGWLGFGLGRELEPVGPPPPRRQPLPRFDLAFHDHVVRCDAAGDWWFEALWTPERSARLSERLAIWRGRLQEPPPAPRRVTAGPLRVPAPGVAGHRSAVTQVTERIAEGELSQANICLRLEGSITGDPLELWLRAVRDVAPAHAAYVGGDDHAVLCLSPELFLRRRGRSVTSRPIKGTAPADTDPEILRASDKDRAENVMIVDLIRNDLGRVCEYGSVRVPQLYAIEPAAGVWHLVSTVEGTLRAGVGDGELLRATFPPGSVTGAPKVQAQKVIHALEPTAREAYCGAIGFASPLAGLELSVTIRTLEVRGETLWLGAGGGIVADSSPEGEVQEALAKARGVAAAAAISVTTHADPSVPLAGPLAADPRPDPAAGVYETIFVRDGTAVMLSAHLQRLAASARALGLALPDDVETELVRAAATLGNGGLRLALASGGTELSTRGLPRPGPTTLRPVVVPGGLGAHKWLDRGLIDALSVDRTTPLICDLDGHLLEAGYAAVMIVHGGELIMPPLDGRQLPSISRTRIARMALEEGLTVRQAPITLTEARAADAVVLGSSLRGPHPGVLAGGPPPERSGAICARLRTTPW
jgi:para-aminobenzoate synthetase/4-amino-4-deoxychorismate lyase